MSVHDGVALPARPWASVAKAALVEALRSAMADGAIRRPSAPGGWRRSAPGRWSPRGGGVRERRGTLALTVLLILLACPIGSVHAQALWRDSAVGMGVEQVRERFPDAVVPDVPEALYSGAKEQLRIPELELAGHRFEASFFFIEGRLAQVTLGLLDATDGDVAKQGFDAVSQALREEHGEALTSERSTGMVTKSRATWRSGPTHVVLLYLVVGRADPLLNLVYQELPPDP